MSSYANPTIRTLFVVALLLVAGLGPVSAQEEIRAYLLQTDSVLLKFKANVEEFLPAIKELREKKDLVSLRDAGFLYAERWKGLMSELDNIKPPAEAAEYHKAFRHLCELQRESNQVMSETLTQRLSTLSQARIMKESGVSDDEIDTFIRENSPDKDELLARTQTIKSQTQTSDSIFKSERKRLLELIGESSSNNAFEERVESVRAKT